MKKYNLLLLFALVFSFVACDPDPELDPIQFDKLKQSSIIALRGTAYNNLFDDSYEGAVDKFSMAKTAGESFEFEADYLSGDFTSLSKVEVYGQFKKGTRTKLATIEGSTFAVPSGGKYPRGKISIPLSTILTTLNLKAPDSFEASDAIIITSDLVLKDGSSILAANVTNSSLSEGAHFFPAHTLRYLVTE